MPWCPKCKMEYQPGVTMCSDCKVELVDELKDALIPFFQAEEKKVAEKLVKFFQYSDLDSSVGYDEENDLYIVSVDPKKQMEAKKLYQAFYFVERERMEKGESDIFTANTETAEEEKTLAEVSSDKTDTADSADTSDEAEAVDTSDTEDEAYHYDLIEPEADKTEKADDNEKTDDTYETPGDEVNAFDDEDEDSASTTYVMKADQYKDLSGTVWIFLLFGIAGLIFVVLNVIGILSVFTSWLPNAIMGALFLFFIYVALSTQQKAKKVRAEIDVENKLTEKINEWLKQNVTKEFLASVSSESVSKELNYLKQVDTIKEMLIKEFGNQNLSYLDRLIEEYYSRTFDLNEE